MPLASFMVQCFIMYCNRVVENDIIRISNPFHTAHRELAIEAYVQRNTWDPQLRKRKKWGSKYISYQK